MTISKYGGLFTKNVLMNVGGMECIVHTTILKCYNSLGRISSCRFESKVERFLITVAVTTSEQVTYGNQSLVNLILTESIEFPSCPLVSDA